MPCDQLPQAPVTTPSWWTVPLNCELVSKWWEKEPTPAQYTDLQYEVQNERLISSYRILIGNFACDGSGRVEETREAGGFCESGDCFSTWCKNSWFAHFYCVYIFLCTCCDLMSHYLQPQYSLHALWMSMIIYLSEVLHILPLIL